MVSNDYDKIGPKFGIDCATNRTESKIVTRIITLLGPNSFSS